AAQRPTLGICLGAQLIAAALGAKVFPGTNGKEIGWSAVFPPQDAPASAILKPLFNPELKVLHWHGDTFEIPAGAQHLASSRQYANQAFAVENFALALQFHPEVQTRQLERWYIGHAAELSRAGISIQELRDAGLEYGHALEQVAKQLWTDWLQAANLM
ncbi:MAG: glutamine amidotransferase, partial [Steroidobacter sp.]